MISLLSLFFLLFIKPIQLGGEVKNYEKIRVGVILAGCGVLDGSEIHEATLTLLYLDQEKTETIIMAPDIEQMHVINHVSQETEKGESRNVLIEAARIARGNIKDLSLIKAEDIDALILPGGFGAAKNLSDFAVEGEKFEVNPDVEKLILDTYNAKKPIGFICIAPVIAAKVLGKYNPEITIGHDKSTARTIENLGAVHIPCNVNNIIVDEKNLVVTTPAYMLGPEISDVAQGIKKLVGKIIELAAK